MGTRGEHPRTRADRLKRTHNPLAAGSSPARPTSERIFQDRFRPMTSTATARSSVFPLDKPGRTPTALKAVGRPRSRRHTPKHPAHGFHREANPEHDRRARPRPTRVRRYGRAAERNHQRPDPMSDDPVDETPSRGIMTAPNRA